MLVSDRITRPSKQDQRLASLSFETLAAVLKQAEGEKIEIEIEETKEKLVLPVKALRLLSDILKAMREGKLVSIVPVATEMTTQAAAGLLNCSRPHLVKLLEEGKLPFTKVGKHRRIKYDELMKFKKERKAEQKGLLTDIMNEDDESGLYDS